MKKCVAIALMCLLSMPSAWAIPIWQLDRMSDKDANRYINALIESIKAACQNDPALHTKVKEFLKLHDNSLESWEHGLYGWDKFLDNLAYARVADLRAFANDPKAPRLEVEEVLYATLVRNGIVLPPNHWREPFEFEPQDPLRPIATMDFALKQVEYSKEAAEGAAMLAKPAGNEQKSSWTDADTAIAFFAAIAVIIAVSSSRDSAPAKGGASSSNPFAGNSMYPPGLSPDDLRQAHRSACAAILDTKCLDPIGNPW